MSDEIEDYFREHPRTKQRARATIYCQKARKKWVLYVALTNRGTCGSIGGHNRAFLAGDHADEGYAGANNIIPTNGRFIRRRA